MPLLRLVPVTLALADTLDAGPDAFRAAHGLAPGPIDLVREVVGQTLALPAALPWAGYLALEAPDYGGAGAVVGTCAFKDAPDSEGRVEIAYYTFPPHEGRGVAGAMARALLAVAAAAPEVREVVAHTLPEANASTHVLKRAGFAFVGDHDDPEDGPVWRWTRDPALSPVAGVAEALAEAVDAAAPRLLALPDTIAATPPAPGKWSAKEVIGHLIDSAANNHQRFVRAQEGGPFEGPGYAQDAWVARQRYRDAPWGELVELWRLYNRHLARVMAAIPAAALTTPCRIGVHPPVPLGYVAEDYLAHLRHHLRGVIGD